MSLTADSLRVWGRNARVRSVVMQAAILAAAVGVIAWLVDNTLSNLASRGIATGFEFLTRSARFPISESVLPYDSLDSVAWAFTVGLGNTVFASALIIVLATMLGFVVAMGRRSGHPLARGIAGVFVETLRNSPLVVQLLFWYAVVTVGLPNPHEALNPLAGVYISNRGFYLPWPSLEGGSLSISYPTLGRFNFSGGMVLTPEFSAMLAGLVFYSAAFIGEIVRGGIDAVGRGQWEAGRAIGLSESVVLRQIVLPQAMRVIIPPLTSQYLNLTKNSSLAVAVGYPELVSIANTTLNQTGRAIEALSIVMLVYLALSLITSALMNWFNASAAIQER